MQVLFKTYKLFNNRDQFGPRWKISYTNCESRLVMKDTLKIKLKASEIKDISPCVCGHSPTPQPQQVAFSSQPFHYSCKFRIIPTRIFNKKPCRPTRHGKSKYPQDNIKSIGWSQSENRNLKYFSTAWWPQARARPPLADSREFVNHWSVKDKVLAS